MYIVKYSERVHLARMHELASASPPTSSEYFTIYIQLPFYYINPLNGYFKIDSAPIYNIQDHPAFHFALVNLKTIISSALAGYSCSPETLPIGTKW